MTFHDEFSKILAKSNTTIYYLSKTTGIDRRAIYRLKDGTKKPSFEEISKIVMALSLTKEDSEKLWRAYKISSVGEEKFLSRERTKKFLETLAVIYESRDQTVTSFTKSNVDISEETTTIIGTPSINTMLRNIFSLENSSNGFIYAQSNLSYEFLFDELAYQININRDMEVKVFINLKVPEESLYTDSIYAITKLYPLLLLGKNTEAKYGKSTSDSNALFPHNIVTSNYLVSISSDLQCAIVTKSKSVIKTTKQIFIDVFRNCSPLVLKMDMGGNVASTLKGVFGVNGSKIKAIYSMDYEPCVTLFIDSYTMDQLLNKDCKEVVDIMDVYSQVDLDNLSVISHFTLEGLRWFLTTGTLFGIPKEYYKEFNRELLIRLIKNLYFAYKAERFSPHVINSNNFRYPKNFRYSGNGTIYDYFFISLSNEEYIFNTMPLNENGLSSHFYDFVESLSRTNLVYSAEESMKMILEETEKILDYKFTKEELESR